MHTHIDEILVQNTGIDCPWERSKRGSLRLLHLFVHRVRELVASYSVLASWFECQMICANIYKLGREGVGTCSREEAQEVKKKQRVYAQTTRWLLVIELETRCTHAVVSKEGRARLEAPHVAACWRTLPLVSDGAIAPYTRLRAGVSHGMGWRRRG